MILAAAYRPWKAGPDGHHLLERAILVTLAAIAAQLVPLPAFAIDLISPHARAVWQRLSLEVPSALPISIDLSSGVWAVVVGAGVVTTFQTARRMFTGGGVRVTLRGVSFIGLALAAEALAQDATAHGRMYWIWPQSEVGAPPFGPFGDRNHFATWVVLALPMLLGYLAAHTSAHRRNYPTHVSWRRRAANIVDARAIWLTASVVLLAVALADTLSRSGLFGLAVAALAGAALRPTGSGRESRVLAWAAGAAAIAVMLILIRIDPASLAARLSPSRIAVSAGDRVVIWRDTIPLIRDFWLTGTGAGTYETAMLVYQRTFPGVRFNQAHDQYLQLAAEGGLLLVVPFAIALWAYARMAFRALQSDRSDMYWVRCGALCGLLGVAAQGIWETGLLIPANALLAAVAAAIVIHAPGHAASGTP